MRLAMMALLRARAAVTFVNPALRRRVMRSCSLQAGPNVNCPGGRTCGRVSAAARRQPKMGSSLHGKVLLHHPESYGHLPSA